ncbi:MAG: Ig-like domain-containing protein [Lachnospiraceae bacterium]
MRKKIIAAIMAMLVCCVAVPPVNANAEKRQSIGAWSSFLPGWFGNDGFGGFDDDSSFSLDDKDQENGYWYDAGEWEDGYDDDYYWYDDDNDDYEEELSASDIAVNPEKKEIKKGKLFYISLIPADKSDWEGFSEEDWDEICEENIDSIEYSSTKKSVASVNSFNGKVKARKKGKAVIKTTVSLASGETVVFKTKVTVKE